MDKFLLAENPMTNNDTCIVHTIEPIAIIELSLEKPLKNQYQKKYVYIGADGLREEWTFGIHHFFTTDFNEENHEAKAFKLMDKAWHWYAAYLKWEDEQFDKIEDDN